MPHPVPVVLNPMVRRDNANPNDAAVVSILKGVSPIIIPGPATSVVTAVPAAIVSTILLVPNLARAYATFANGSSSRFMYVKFGAVASLISYSAKVGPGGFLETAFPSYTGIVTAIWSPGPPAFAFVSELI